MEIFQKGKSSKQFWLRLSLVLLDVMAVNVSYFLALLIRFYVNFTFNEMAVRYIPAFKTFAPYYTVCCLAVFFLFKLYNSRWKYAGLGDLNRILSACVVTCAIQVVGSCLFVLRMPITYYVIGAILQFCMIVVSRFSYRVIFLEMERARVRSRKNEDQIRVMVVGVGETAHVVLKHMERDAEGAAKPVCVVDFRADGLGDLMEGLPVLGGIEKIKGALEKYSIECVILADTTMPETVRKQVRSICEGQNVEVQDFGGYFQESRGPVTLRGLMECAKGQVELSLNGIRQVYPSGEQAMLSVPGKYMIKSVSAKNDRLVVELQKDVLVPNDVKEDWVRSYEQESGENISFF